MLTARDPFQPEEIERMAMTLACIGMAIGSLMVAYGFMWWGRPGR